MIAAALAFNHQADAGDGLESRRMTADVGAPQHGALS